MSSTEWVQTGVPSRLRLHALEEAKPTDGGLLFQRPAGSYVLPWHRIQRAFAATIGSGEDARVGFRLVLRQRGEDCEIVQLEIGRGGDAGQYARAILLGLGGDACDASLETLAEEGIAPRRYVEPDVFDEAVLESMRWAASGTESDA